MSAAMDRPYPRSKNESVPYSRRKPEVIVAAVPVAIVANAHKVSGKLEIISTPIHINA
jgi:hypothetical protein